MLGRLLDATILFSFDRSGFERHARAFRPEDLDVDLTGQRYAITGANSGIGFETARGLVQLGGTAVLLCRSVARGEAAAAVLRAEVPSANVEVVGLDVSELDEVDAAVEAIGGQPLHGLIHNAGALLHHRERTRTGMERLCATHLAGPWRLSHRLRPALAAAHGRIIWVSSGGMYTQRLVVDGLDDRDDGPWDGVEVYARTKRAQVVLAGELDRHWPDVRVHAMHPGWADTPAVRVALPRFHARLQQRLRTPAQGADTVVWLAASPHVEGQAGAFWFDRRKVSPYLVPGKREAPEERERLWAWLTEVAG